MESYIFEYLVVLFVEAMISSQELLDTPLSLVDPKSGEAKTLFIE
jgi:hypothetical protein